MRNSTMRSSEKRYLHHCSFRTEKNQRTGDKLITLVKKVCCQLSTFFAHTSTLETHMRTWFVPGKESGFSLKDTKSKFSLKSEPRSRSANFKPILAEEVSRNWIELLSLSEERLIMLSQVMNNSDEINYFFKNHYQNKIGIFVKVILKVFMRWKNWRGFKSYESMNLREEDWSKTRTLSLNSRPEFRDYRMKLVVWMIREISKMQNQFAVDYPT